MGNYTHIWNQEFVNNTRNLKNFDICMEIGCFEGLTTNYIVENMLSTNGKTICVDPLTDNYLNENLTEKDKIDNSTIYSYFNNQFNRFLENTKHNENKIELYRELSTTAFPKLLEKYENKIDFIYIDGDHRASAVYIDAVNSFKLCKSGGYILFDDYSWGKMYNEEATSVGVDKFLAEYSGKYNLHFKNYQVLISKI